MNKDSKLIFERQNQIGLVEVQKTAACCYACGKKLTLWLALVLILVPLVVNVLLLFLDNVILNATLSILSFLSLILAGVLRKKIRQSKFNGAGLQQYFDELVFMLNNSSRKYLAPKKLMSTERLSLICKYKEKDATPYKNWYSDFSALPYEQAVYQCQKQNIRWDLSIRKKYRIFLIVITFILSLLIILNSIWQRQEITSLITVVASIFPLFSYFFSSFRKLNSDITLQEELYKHIEKIEKNITTKKEIWDEVEELQVEIFNYRKKAYLIPDWFHQIFKKETQKNEDEFAKLISKEKLEN